MVKEEKKAPKLRFNGYTNDWERKKLGNVAKITPGGTPSKNISNYWYPKEIPWLSSGEINKEIIFSTDDMISKEGFNNSSAKWIKQDSVLIALAGQGKTRGKVAINRIPLTTNQSIAGIEPSNEVYYKFLYHQLTKDYLKLRLVSSGDGSRGGLNKKLLNDYAVNLSSIDEQHKLGILLSRIDNTLQLHERKCEELTLIKKALLQKLFPKKDEIKPEVRYKNFSDAWEQRKLREVVNFLDTLRKPLEGAKRVKGPYPYYGASGIVDYVDGYLFDEELILLSEDGANITERNYPVCFLASGKYWVNNHAHVLKIKEDNDNNFICNSLERKDYTKYNTGMAMPKLNKETCKGIPIMCPNYDEQKKIGNYFRKFDTLITLHQHKLEKLKQLKKFLLQNMFI
ncbi:restriction endonuclease subunit S [Ligilactobacillus salivarius]|uniref:restriction endonuclease subunit S n=2 Tax=Ligilactobacillus salivarius TaxID=1624 RepID=UPI00237E5ED0|nr:restriction endonuclease subunit S [Ligilactobacillus salivarius]MDE1524770.1 restriction endonuclease subunit S [Ligilactobacillus salivarius]